MKRLTLVCTTALVFCFGTIISYANEPSISGRTAQQSWVAFECSLLASFAKKEEEHARLFNYAYEQGKAFIGAISDKKITEEEINKAPMFMLMMLRGPTPDFMLGHIYGFIEDSVHESITNRMKKEGVSEIGMSSDELRKRWASNMFQEDNCDLIGLALDQTNPGFVPQPPSRTPPDRWDLAFDRAEVDNFNWKTA